MIICTNCGFELKQNEENLLCRNCGLIISNNDSIFIFNPEIKSNSEDYNSEGEDWLYAFENKHFWFIHRKKIILKAFEKNIKKQSRIIEIGAGTGNVSQMLLANGYEHIAVGEMHLNGLQYAKKYGLTALYQFDILKAPFKDHFDVVCMFDVLEHIENDELALQNVRNMLSTGGRLVLTIPAHDWLWSNVDANSGHKRRYNYAGLKALLEKNNFELIYFRSFFTLMLPLLFVRAILNRKKIKLDTASLAHNAGMTINPFVNTIFKFICAIENLFFSSLSVKFGGSLLVVARKIK